MLRDLFYDGQHRPVTDLIRLSRSIAYTSAITETYTLSVTSTSARYLDFDGAAFTISTTRTVTSIAVIADRYVTPLISSVFPNYRPIQDGYIRAAWYINYARTPLNAYNNYGSTGTKVSKQGYILTAAGTYRYDIDSGDNVKRSIAYTLTENTVDISGKKVLMLGDSFVARGYIQNYLTELVPTLQFIGTRTTQNYGFATEGVSGSRLFYYTDPNTSPFYFDDALDFGAYLTENSLDAPDYVVINSAINHNSYNNSTYGSYFENLTELVEMIQAYSTDIKIYVTYGANYAMTPGSTYGYPYGRYREVRTCCNSIYGVDGITVIPVDTALIDELDYPTETVNYFGTDITVLSDCVHPTEAAGFKKIAHMIYNYLGI